MANVPQYHTERLSIGPGILYLAPYPENGIVPSGSFVDVGAVKSGATLAMTRTSVDIKQGFPAVLINQLVSEETATMSVTGLEWNLTNLARVLALDPSKDVEDVAGAEYSGEHIGTGDGNTTHFEETLDHTPVARKTVVVTFSAGGSAPYTATDVDTPGVISGNGCTGSIDYTTGRIVLDFTVAPDNGSEITVDYSVSTKSILHYGGRLTKSQVALKYIHTTPSGAIIEVDMWRAQGNADVTLTWGDDPHEFPYVFNGMDAATDWDGNALPEGQRLVQILYTSV